VRCEDFEVRGEQASPKLSPSRHRERALANARLSVCDRDSTGYSERERRETPRGPGRSSEKVPRFGNLRLADLAGNFAGKAAKGFVRDMSEKSSDADAENQRPWLRPGIAFPLIFVATLCFQLPFFDRWYSLLDEGHVLMFADIVAKGGEIYRDARSTPCPALSICSRTPSRHSERR
jgi:hypothetical protein